MKQLIVVEGLPGTGKSTITRRILERLAAKGENAVALLEGDERIPGDFYEMAGIPIHDFLSIRSRYPETAEERLGIWLQTKNYVFLRLDRCQEPLSSVFRKWDMGDERNQQVSVPDYISSALERLDYWVDSNADYEGSMVIDSGFLQNPINELLFRKASDDDVYAFIQGAAKRYKKLNPFCIYLKRESAEAAISFAKMAKGPEWSSRVDALLSELDCADLFERRFVLESRLLPLVPHLVCFVDGSNWSDTQKKIDAIY